MLILFLEWDKLCIQKITLNIFINRVIVFYCKNLLLNDLSKENKLAAYFSNGRASLIVLFVLIKLMKQLKVHNLTTE